MTLGNRPVCQRIFHKRPIAYSQADFISTSPESKKLGLGITSTILEAAGSENLDSFVVWSGVARAAIKQSWLIRNACEPRRELCQL